MSAAEHDQYDWSDNAPEMVEVCGCGENAGRPVDLDGDGIAEWCILCGQHYTLRAR